MSKPSLFLSRRNFLKLTGLAAGSLLASRAEAAGNLEARLNGSWHRTGRLHRVGVLLPNSSLYPALSENYLTGLTGFREQANSPSIKLVKAAYGIDPAAAMVQARRLIEQEKVDLLVGLVSSGAAARLRDLMHKSQVPLIACNLGENVIRPEEQSPNIFHHTLHAWQSSAVMGAWAAGHVGRRALIASSLYDSGYDTLYAFQLGLQAAGGELVDTFVTHVPPDEGDFTPLFDRIRAVEPDFVYALYCGRQAADFIQAYANSGLAGRVPLVGSPFAADPAFVPAGQAATLAFTSCFSWDRALANPENELLAATVPQPADPFALLGYETGQLMSRAIEIVESGGAAYLAQALGEASAVGPRGSIAAHLAGRASSSAFFLRQSLPAGEATITQLEPAVDLETVAQTIRAGVKTGWTNAYLCV